MNDKRNLYFGVIGMVLGITLALIGILYYDYLLHIGHYWSAQNGSTRLHVPLGSYYNSQILAQST